MASPLLLASNSPRRRELLTAAGFVFEIFAPKTDERSDKNLTLREITALNAVRKGTSLGWQHADKVILSADTLVALDDQIMGKPRDLAQAVRMLERLSGREHEVCSTVFVLHPARAKSVMFHEISRVRFRRLSRDRIRRYLSKINPLDKAGAYAAQGYGTEIISRIEGSYTNVVGLPMEQTAVVLAEFGIAPVPT